MFQWWLYTVASIPSVVVCYWMFRLDKYEKEPYWVLALTFFLGALATIPCVALEQYFFCFFEQDDLLNTFFLAFLAIATNEEILKCLVVLACAYPWSFFNEPMDGLVYAVFASMGFVAAENMAYAQRFGVETAIVRAFTAVPAHLLFAIVMGYYLGRAKFEEPKFAWRLIGRGLLFTIIAHGLYDVLLLQKLTDWLVAAAPVAIYIGLYYSSSLWRIHQEQSPFRPESTML